MHCHSGKDRTGLASALTLTLAGVASADVAEDYAETAARMSLDAQLAALPGEAERARSRRLFAEVGAGTMLATLVHLDDRYGGAALYLREGGLPPRGPGPAPNPDHRPLTPALACSSSVRLWSARLRHPCTTNAPSRT
ncbi:tyrosine-protein phosphatase [Nonomuraea sp. NPDC049504]|uniref:tyrosine-protein phosphatase n=1 Tax=Nonomuraea sp. NPDC049504 TaxID=3154729 RepID=UPI003447139C